MPARRLKLTAEEASSRSIRFSSQPASQFGNGRRESGRVALQSQRAFRFVVYIIYIAVLANIASRISVNRVPLQSPLQPAEIAVFISRVPVAACACTILWRCENASAGLCCVLKGFATRCWGTDLVCVAGSIPRLA